MNWDGICLSYANFLHVYKYQYFQHTHLHRITIGCSHTIMSSKRKYHCSDFAASSSFIFIISHVHCICINVWPPMLIRIIPYHSIQSTQTRLILYISLRTQRFASINTKPHQCTSISINIYDAATLH